MAITSEISQSGSLIARVASRPFQTSFPEIINRELIPPDLWASYSRLWGLSYPYGEIDIYEVKDAVVDGPGLVYDRHLHLIHQSIHEATNVEIDGYTWGVGEGARLGSIPFHPGTTVLCEKSGIGNYGHWLVEMLPRAFVVRAEVQAEKWRLRLPLAGQAMNTVMRDSLKLIGTPNHQIVDRKPGPERYESLIMITGISRHGQRYSPITTDVFDEMGRSVTPWPSKHVWITRGKTNRRLSLEFEVCDALATHGWTIVDPAEMSLVDQIACFKGAARIAGVAGAGLTNVAFARRGTPVTIFMPANMPDIFYWSLADFGGLPFREVRCPIAAGTAAGNWDGLLDIPVDEVLRLLL